MNSKGEAKTVSPFLLFLVIQYSLVMLFTLLQYNKWLKEALQKTYKAVMFDFDGTLNDIGEFIPVPEEMKEKLQELCVKVPLAFATARSWNTAKRRLTETLSKRFDELKKYWAVICENGSAGYYFDENKNDFVEFYRVPWPESEISKSQLIKKMKSVFGELIGELIENPTSLIIRPHTHAGISPEKLSTHSKELENLVREVLLQFPGSTFLHFGNSKMGISIVPQDGDKDRGAREFCKFLKQKRNMAFDEKCSELVLIGDNPLPGGNDYYFLSGEVGTPFTVGELKEDAHWPLPVFDEMDQLVKGPKGTLALLNQLKFS